MPLRNELLRTQALRKESKFDMGKFWTVIPLESRPKNYRKCKIEEFSWCFSKVVKNLL